MSNLLSHINSDFVTAANRLRGRKSPRHIVAYVESYDDILFWNELLSEVESDDVRFDVMLPSRTSLTKGKKMALANNLGPDMIACVDADYDFVLQGATPASHKVCNSPYVLHTYAYAIENHQCYAPTLQRVCVAATLNDRVLIDFEAFMAEYSRIIWPLFVWNVWTYRYELYQHFDLTAFASVVKLHNFSIHHPTACLETLRRTVNRKVAALQRQFPQGKKSYAPLRASLLALGLTPETTYLFMRGHDLHDGVVSPVLNAVCSQLRREREAEIFRLACHERQHQNEFASYQRAITHYEDVLRKHSAFRISPLYRRIIADAQALAKGADNANSTLSQQTAPD